MYPGVNRLIRKGEIIARIKNMFGNIIEEYFAPCTGIVSCYNDVISIETKF